MVDRWYVKSPGQSLVEATMRAAALGCPVVLESTSAQVNAFNPLPHAIVQTRLGATSIFTEPATRAQIEAVVDEPLTPSELLMAALAAKRHQALLRLQALDLATVVSGPLQGILADLLVATGVREPLP